MTTINRFLATLFLLTTGLVGVGRMLAMDVTDDLQDDDGPPAIKLLSAPPEARVILRRMEAKTAVIASLLRGETNLFEAAGRFRRFNSDTPETTIITMRLMPGDSLNEKTCRQVISWVYGQLGGTVPNSELKKTVDRLEEELDGHLAKHGRVILPGWEGDE